MYHHIPNHIKQNNNTFFCDQAYFLSEMFTPKKFKIVILTTDHLSTEASFWSADQKPCTQLEKLVSKTQQFPNNNFVIVHNCLNINFETPNCKFIHWAPEWIANVNYTAWYNKVLPQQQKNFDQDNFWICLNRNKRVHRYLSCMFLLGNNLETNGLITLTPDEVLEHDNFESWVHWWNYNDRKEIQDIKNYYDVLQQGFDKIKKIQGFQRNYYGKVENNFLLTHEENFNQFLRPLYQNSLVEIINETVWFPDAGGIVSEKFVNSVYGYTLPIMIGVCNTVEYLRSLGFNMFDDVIDHTYDNEPSITLRLIKALDNNKELLNNKNQAVQAWKHCKTGMDQNLKLSQELEKNAGAKWINLLESLV